MRSQLPPRGKREQERRQSHQLKTLLHVFHLLAATLSLYLDRVELDLANNIFFIIPFRKAVLFVVVERVKTSFLPSFSCCRPLFRPSIYPKSREREEHKVLSRSVGGFPFFFFFPLPPSSEWLKLSDSEPNAHTQEGRGALAHFLPDSPPPPITCSFLSLPAA